MTHWKAANNAYKQGQALYDLDHGVKMSTTGMRPELGNTAHSTPETLDPKKAFARLNRMYDTGRLQQAVGPHAADLLQSADAAFLHQAKIVARQQALKTAAKVAGVGAAAGAVGEAGHVMKDALSSN